MTATTTLSPSQQLGQRVFHLITNGDKGAAYLVAQQGWRDFPGEILAQTPNGDMTFETLTVILAGELGRAAEPAAPVESQSPAAPVSAPPAPVSAPPAAPVSAAPVSAAPAVMPVSAAPVSPAGTAAIVIERTVEDGTVIVPPEGSPKLNGILKPLGWAWAKRGFYYLGDRDTAPNIHGIQATLGALGQAGLMASTTVVGNEPPRPVSAPPARPVSAPPARPVSAPAVRRGANPTRRQQARQASPVEVRYVQPTSPVPAPPVSVAPVSAAPVSAPAAPATDPTLAAMMQQMQAMQATLAALVSGQVPAAPVAAVAPVSAAPVSPATIDAESALALLIDQKKQASLAKVSALSWQFRLADGAHGRHTRGDLAQRLRAEVGGWWEHHFAGTVTFSVRVDKDTPGVLHVMVTGAGGDVSATKVSEQVVGIALTTRGIKGRSTTKLA